MLLGGLMAFHGAVKSNSKRTSFVVTTIIFAGVVLGRSLSLFVDGVPSQDLIRAASVEGILTALNIICLISILIQDRES